MSIEETYSTVGPGCPYCGHMHNPSDEPSHYYNEMLDETDCNNCGKTFNVEVYVSHSWTCTTKEPTH